MAVNQFYVIQYANAIYCNGKKSFTGHNNTPAIPTDYHQPVKDYAAANYSKTNILDVSLGQNWITKNDYDETIALRTASSPA